MHGITKFSKTHTGNFIFDLKSRVNEQLVKSTSLPKFPPLLPTYSAPQLLSFDPLFQEQPKSQPIIPQSLTRNIPSKRKVQDLFLVVSQGSRQLSLSWKGEVEIGICSGGVGSWNIGVGAVEVVSLGEERRGE